MKTLYLLIKPVSAACNMKCRYCFYSGVSNARKVKNHGAMPYDLLETLVRKALSEAKRRCVFGFQGGEPLLAGMDFYARLIELEKKHNVNNIKVGYALQTNGLLLNEAWAEFFRANNFLIGLSIDSEKQTHDMFRADANGNGTHGRCVKAALLLARYKVDFNILCVVTKQAAAHPDKLWRFYARHGFKHLQFVPCIEPFGAERAAYSLDADCYGEFLRRIFDLWYAAYQSGQYVSVRDFENYARILAGRSPENCALSGACGAYALVESDGAVYPCDFYAFDDYKLGRVQTHSFAQMLTGGAAERFAAPSREVDPKCAACEYCNVCRGGCRRNRDATGGGALGLNVYCKAYKSLFAHALPRMAEFSRRLASM